MAAAKRILALVLLVLFPSLVLAGAQGEILIGKNAGPLEAYAARELQRYLYQLSGTLLEINENAREARRPAFVIGRATTNPIVKMLLAEGKVRLSSTEPGPEMYRSADPSFIPGPATFLTYVASGTRRFRDNGEGWEGGTLRGVWYYRVTTVDKEGRESAPSAVVRVTYGEDKQ